ncbi:folate-binding protein [Methylomonas sp. AM2-LC]|uniref:CAF17-like 4Fe-4S cluster assembly/insertion protein YgfZ n=1 Tax=Methylomonas sp. AM2-LC TaxID=3153301 RepID=UPI003265628B
MHTADNPILSKIFSLDYLALLTVTGKDSANFLQGQLTCDIHSLTDNSFSLAAFCNPKGRVISTLLVIKVGNDFLLVLPASIQEIVRLKLQRYILRSAVKIDTQATDQQIMGGYSAPQSDGIYACIKLPGSVTRFLWIRSGVKTVGTTDNSEWYYQDICSGLPWFAATQTELYTPHMLGIDRLNGISFTKGCYTGQEIVARTHYLGQAKRTVFRAECNEIHPWPQVGDTVIDSLSQQSAGSILTLAVFANQLHLLMVLSIAEAETAQLALNDVNKTPLKLTDIT